jgi:hypothetical protein
MARALFAFTIIKEPPGPWEIEVRAPAEWAGRFRSQDGISWWSPVLDRPLGERHANPGEDHMLRRLQAIARAHEVTQLQAVAGAARELLNAIELTNLRTSDDTSAVGRATDALADALEVLDGAHPRVSDEAALVVARPGIYEYEAKPFRHVSPQYVGDGLPNVKGYTPTDNDPEPDEVPS